MENQIPVGIYLALWGIFAGLLVSAPMGPSGILVIQRTLNKGRLPGLFTGLGAVMSDLFYAVLTVYAYKLVDEWLNEHMTTLMMTAGILLFFYSIYLWKNNPASAINKKDPNVIAIEKRRLSSLGILKYTTTGFLLTVSNPFVVISFGLLFAPILPLFESNNMGLFIDFFLFVVAGAVCWWLFITWIVNRVRNHFKLRTLRIINRSIAILMFLFAGWSLYQAFVC